MKKSDVLHIAHKSIPLAERQEQAGEFQRDFPSLSSIADPLAEAILIPQVMVMMMKDHEFRRFVALPMNFLMDEKTLKVVQERMDRLGISYQSDVKNKSISTEHNEHNEKQDAKDRTGAQNVE